MELRETDTEFDAAVGWVIKHPGRAKAFPNWTDQQIKAAFKFFRTNHAALIFYEDTPKRDDTPKQVTGAALVGLYPEISTAYVVGMVGKKSTIVRAVGAWASRCPTWRVVARRSGKLHSYSIAALCRHLRLKLP